MTLPGAGLACKHCNQTLRKGVSSPLGKYKACPNCSGNTLKEHAFRKLDEFGVTVHRVTANAPDGIHSWCEGCRSLKEEDRGYPPNGASYTLCSDVAAKEV